MSADRVVALLPLLAVAAGAVLVMAAVAVHRSHALACAVTLAALAASLALLAPAAARAPVTMDSLLIVDRSALFYTGLLAAAALAVALLACGYMEGLREQREEFYILLLTATLGAGVIVSSRHYVSFFLGLEILSVSLYGLVAYRREEAAGIEAGLKYLVLAGVSSAFLLFGIALIYAASGSLELSPWRLPPGCPSCRPMALAGIGLFAVGVGFKLALVPFHLWTPDVYQGAPLPVAALLATVSKGAVLAFLARYAALLELSRRPEARLVFGVIAGVSMFAGNLLALRQDNLKRLLACSSIAQMGYLLVPLAAGGELAGEAAAFALTAYIVASLGAFGALTALSPASGEIESLEQVRGLAWRRPGPAAVLTGALLSLAGLPLTAGFVGKVYLLAAGAGAGLWALAVVLVVNSAIGLYYYLRVIVALFTPAPEAAVGPQAAVAEGGPAVPAVPGPPEAAAPAVTPAVGVPLLGGMSLVGGISLAVLTLALVVLGVLPSALIGLIRAAVSGGP